jgi:subtilisin family serine protease
VKRLGICNQCAAFVLLVLGLAALLLGTQCRHEVAETDADAGRSLYGKSVLGKSAFSDQRVLVVLDQAASRNFRTYSPEDFPGVRCNRVDDLTALTMETILKQREAEKTGNWSKLKHLTQRDMLVKAEKVRRVLCLTLTEKSVENVLTVIRQLSKRDEVVYAGPDYVLSLNSASSAPYHADQWAVGAIQLPDAWEIATGAGVMVGVLDSGIYANHPFFENRIHPTLNREFIGLYGDPDEYPDDGMPENPPTHENFHGTFVSGIIGLCGEDITLVSLKVVSTDGGCYSSNLINAIAYAGSVGIPILNLSAGWESWNGSDMTNYYKKDEYYDNHPLESVIGEYPGLFVCSAGNAGNDNDVNDVYPASFNLPNLITVGATTFDMLTGEERMAGYPDFDWSWNAIAGSGNSSNYGAGTVHLFAPGTGIVSTYTDPSMGYLSSSGTSFAAPFVTGIAALLLSNDPTMTPEEIKAAILGTVDLIPSLASQCVSGGRLNAYQALVGSPVIVTDIPVIGGVPVPVIGGTPVTQITATSQYTGTVAWSPNHTVFAPGTRYTATISLAAEPGYTFRGVPANFFTLAGAGAINSINSGEVTAVFPATASIIDSPGIVGSFDIVVNTFTGSSVMRARAAMTPMSIMDVHGPIGAFTLYEDGTWAVSEDEAFRYVMDFDPENESFFDYLEWPIPSEITDYLDQEGMAAVVPLTVEFPVIDASNTCIYGAYSMDIRISGSGVELIWSDDHVEVVMGSISYVLLPIRAVPVSGELEPAN